MSNFRPTPKKEKEEETDLLEMHFGLLCKTIFSFEGNKENIT